MIAVKFLPLNSLIVFIVLPIIQRDEFVGWITLSGVLLPIWIIVLIWLNKSMKKKDQ